MVNLYVMKDISHILSNTLKIIIYKPSTRFHTSNKRYTCSQHFFQITASNNYAYTHHWNWSFLPKDPIKHEVWRPFMQVTVHRWFRRIPDHVYLCSTVVLISLSPKALFKLKATTQLSLLDLQNEDSIQKSYRKTREQQLLLITLTLSNHDESK